MASDLLDLNWSLRPVNFCLRCTTGVDLQGNENKFLISFYQFFCLLANLVVQIFVIRLLYYDLYSVIELEHNSHNHSSNNLTTTKMCNVVIDYVNWTVLEVVVHAILLLVIRPRWPQLMCPFLRLKIQIDRGFYIKLKRLSIIGVSLMILFVSCLYHFKRYSNNFDSSLFILDDSIYFIRS